MKIVTVELSMDDYVLYLLQHVARKLKTDTSADFRQEMRLLAINAYNAISYSIQLDSGRHPIDED